MVVESPIAASALAPELLMMKFISSKSFVINRYTNSSYKFASTSLATAAENLNTSKMTENCFRENALRFYCITIPSGRVEEDLDIANV
jgi:hypothetical protein